MEGQASASKGPPKIFQFSAMQPHFELHESWFCPCIVVVRVARDARASLRSSAGSTEKPRQRPSHDYMGAPCFAPAYLPCGGGLHSRQVFALPRAANGADVACGRPVAQLYAGKHYSPWDTRLILRPGGGRRTPTRGRRLTFDMSGGAKGAKRPLGRRPLDGAVRPHVSERGVGQRFQSHACTAGTLPQKTRTSWTPLVEPELCTRAQRLPSPTNLLPS